MLKAAGAPTDQITLGVDALLAEGGGRVMLFDTGLGPAVHGVLQASLAQAGVRPEAVTDVFITHSHGDHVGGLVTADGRPAFPHALVHMSTAEWAFMRAQPPQSRLDHRHHAAGPHLRAGDSDRARGERRGPARAHAGPGGL